MHHLTVPRRHAQVPHRIRLAGAIVAGLLVAGAVRAQPSPPWSPDAGGRHDLALLADEADLALPLTQWPLPRAAVQRALAALPAQLPPALEAARARVQRQLAEAAGSQLSIGVRTNLDEALGGFADETVPGSWIALRPALDDSHDRVVLQLSWFHRCECKLCRGRSIAFSQGRSDHGHQPRPQGRILDLLHPGLNVRWGAMHPLCHCAVENLVALR